jgi:hypothetical protein
MTSNKLRIANIIAAMIQFSLAIYWIILKSNSSTSDYFNVYENRHNSYSYIPTNEKVGFSNIENDLIKFFIITGIFHLFYAFDFKGIYTRQIEAGKNNFRWIEYSLTASTMIKIIARTCGVSEASTLRLMEYSTIGCMLQGLIIENTLVSKELDPTTKKTILITSNIVGWGIMSAVFFEIFKSFNNYKKDLAVMDVKIPSFVTPIIYSQFLLFNSFGFLQLYEIFNYNKVNYENIELGYLVLSMTAKSSLGIALIQAMENTPDS